MYSLKIIGAVCCLVIISFGVALGDGWHIETVDDNGDVGFYTSIALDSLDYPHISYCDYSIFLLKYAYWTGSTWSISTVDTTGMWEDWLSMALDSSDNPHIVYYDANNYDLKYAYWTGSTWSINSVAGDKGACCSIALDSVDYPHISYCDFPKLDLKYAYWTGSVWSITSVDTAGDLWGSTSIALDSAGYPHISYYDFTNGDLKYARWTGSAWSITSVDTAADVGGCASIALDSTDYPHISYYDSTNGDLKYARWTGSAWSISSVDTAGDVGKYTSIALYSVVALGSVDNPHISYYDSTNEYLKYAHWTGAAWSITSIDATAELWGATSIALDSSGYPHISYGYSDFYISGNGSDKYYHKLKYAFYSPAPDDFNLLSPPNYTYVSSTPTMDWEDAEDVNPVIYSLWYSTENDFDPHEEVNNLTISNYTFPEGVLNDGEAYYWKVVAYDGSYGTWSGPDDYWSFIVNYTDINLLSFTAQADKNNTIVLNWQVETTQGEQIAGFNLYRREISSVEESYSFPPQKKDEGWTKINTSLITGQNPYAYTDGDVQGGLTYEYKLEAVLVDESTEILGTASCAPTPPAFGIVSLYPNPAYETMTCLLSVPNAGTVELELYDLSGRMVLEKQINAIEPNEISVVLDVCTLASGVYTLQATCGGVEASARCVVAR